jgi:Uma2 family endonuclease
MVEILHKINTAAFYEGDKEMSEHAWQHNLVAYLESVIKWLYYKEGWFVTGNLDIFSEKISHPIAPDVLFFKGVALTSQEIAELSSWQIELPDRPPPTVVIEISSKSTGKGDFEEKPEIYRVLGVKEYFAFDPKTYWGKKQKDRLLGWRYNDCAITELKPDADGRVWSEELNSWLVADGLYLRLYDMDTNLRLTKEENLILRLQEKGFDLSEFGL